MNLDELAAEIGDGTFRPAYLLAGEEALLRDDAMAQLREAPLSLRGATLRRGAGNRATGDIRPQVYATGVIRNIVLIGDTYGHQHLAAFCLKAHAVFFNVYRISEMRRTISRSSP